AAVESIGLVPDGRLFALNSYENRVYRLGLDEPLQGATAVVAKFYRASRWSDAQILEEHAFAAELVAADIPVAPALSWQGATLHQHEHYRFALFALQPGGSPDLDQPGARALLGRTLGRIHARGALQSFRERRRLAAGFGAQARESLLESDFIPEALLDRYAGVSEDLVAGIRDAFEMHMPANIRLHGDCHLGNILWSARGPVFVDLDDCMQGPRVQDLWMFVAGDSTTQQHEWQELMEGYEQFTSLDYGELALIEPLRALRMMNHAAWLAARWDDPAFPKAFPWFGEARFWERHIDDLFEQLQTMHDPPLLRV
ncbi:MAG: serine/threonine protein kinase, partial [Steroidobacteraceae bacterium]